MHIREGTDSGFPVAARSQMGRRCMSGHELLERLKDVADREPDDIAVGSVNALNIRGKASLDRVGARLVHGLTGACVREDFLLGHRIDADGRLFGK